jgi:tetratricopeptide (TPR) repeat protein
MASVRRALELRERSASEHPSDSEHQSKLGEILNDTALCEMRPGRWNDARKLLDRAIEHQRKALYSAPANPTYRQLLRNHLANLVNVYQALARPTEALRAERELAELFDRGFPEDPFSPRD